MIKNAETTALFQIIEAISSVDEDRRQAIVDSAMVWCKGRKATPRVGRPRKKPVAPGERTE